MKVSECIFAKWKSESTLKYQLQLSRLESRTSVAVSRSRSANQATPGQSSCENLFRGPRFDDLDPFQIEI